MSIQITKENYRTLVWDENISFDDCYAFCNALPNDEQAEFLQFLLANYPNYDDEWIQTYFNVSSHWREEGAWEKLADFSDILRTKAPIAYKKEFNYLDEDPILYALFHNDLDKVKERFAETIVQPETAVDDTLRTVFNILSTDRSLSVYTAEVAEQVWKPLEQSTKLMGGAEFEYSAYLYCEYITKEFEKIQAGIPVDWSVFTKNVKAINFKYVEEFAQLPNFKVAFDQDQFNTNEGYRNEQLNEMLISFLYYAHTDLGIPVYWAFRGWFDLQKYLLYSDDAPKRANWLAFTPKMLEKMGGKLYGLIGSNKEGMFIVTWVLPYIYDFFLQHQHINEATFSKLMEYYDYARRETLSAFARDLWKYKGVYSWKKPGYLSTEIYEKERALLLQSITVGADEAKKNMKVYLATLPALPDYVIPPVELSPFAKMLASSRSSGSSAPSSSPSRPPRRKRPSNRKKKHKDNRKRGAKKGKRK